MIASGLLGDTEQKIETLARRIRDIRDEIAEMTPATSIADLGADDEDRGTGYAYDEARNYYAIWHTGSSYSLSGRIVDDMCRWYSNRNVGGDQLTSNAVVRQLASVHDIEMRGIDARRIFKSLEHTKDCIAAAPHKRMGAAPEALAQSLAGRDAQIEAIMRREEIDNLRKQVSRLRKQLASVTSLTDRALDGLVEPLRLAVEPIRYEQYDHELEPCELIVFLSDWHIGQSFETIGNTFNLQVAKRRVMRLIHEVCSFVFDRRRPVERIHIALGGDMIDGSLRPQQHLSQDLPLHQQGNHCAELMAHLIEAVRLRASCPVDVYAACGNHGRMTRDRKDDEVRVIEHMTYQITAAKCPNVTWHMQHNNKPIVWRVGTTGVILTHGDKHCKRKVDHAAPYRATMRDVTHWVVLTGHYHYAKSVDHLDTTWVQSGSLCGPDDYATDHLGVGARASQCIVEIRRDGPRPAYVIPLQ